MKTGPVGPIFTTGSRRVPRGRPSQEHPTPLAAQVVELDEAARAGPRVAAALPGGLASRPVLCSPTLPASESLPHLADRFPVIRGRGGTGWVADDPGPAGRH